MRQAISAAKTFQVLETETAIMDSSLPFYLFPLPASQRETLEKSRPMHKCRHWG
jgi:hypothetical protein